LPKEVCSSNHRTILFFFLFQTTTGNPLLIMTTTTTEIFEHTSTMESFMLPGLVSPHSRVVRFDNECVLIPKTSTARSKMPVVLTKSYSLPLWKRKSNHFSDSDVEDATGSPTAQPSSPEDNRITIKVPIPTFVSLQLLILILLKNHFFLQV